MVWRKGIYTMKQFLKASLMMLAFFGLNAAAQDWYHDRDLRFRGEEWRAHLFEHVRMDLDHVESVTGGWRDRQRLDRTRHQLDDLQYKLHNRVYDEHELNEVIRDLGRVVTENRMGPRERDILNDDRRRMEDYRAHHDRWYR